MTDDEIFELALSIILESNPKIAATRVDPDECAALGITEYQYKFQLLSEALEQLAKQNRMTTHEFQLRLLEEKGYDVTAARLRADQAQASILGLR